MSQQGLCPACRTPLQRAHATYGVFACPACGGIWADTAASQALRAAADPSIVQASTAAAARARFAAPADQPGRACPSCLGALATSTIHGAVAIDYCMSHGTWFDRGEIERIVHGARSNQGAAASSSSSTGGEIAWGVLEVCGAILAGLAD